MEYSDGTCPIHPWSDVFYLHSSFNNGSVVLRTSTAQSFNLPLSPAEDVLKFFREDLEVAYDLLPVPQDVTSDYEGLATKVLQQLSKVFHTFMKRIFRGRNEIQGCN